MNTLATIARRIAQAAITALCCVHEKAVCAFANTTDTPVCPVCKRADCEKEIR